MKSILLVEGHPVYQAIYSLTLISILDCEVFIKKNYEETSEYIQSGPLLDLIIYSDVRKEPIQKISGSLPLLMISDKIGPQELIKNCQQSLQIEVRENLNFLVAEIPIFYFLGLERLSCDVFNREGNSLFLRGEKILFDQIQLLLVQGIKKLFIKQQDLRSFIQELTENLLRETSGQVHRSMGLLSEHLPSIRPSLIGNELGNFDLQPLLHLVDSQPLFKDYLQKILKEQTSYRFQHCQFLTILSCHVLHELQWGNRDQKLALAFACFFHDMLLSKDEMVKIHSEEELKSAPLNDKEKEIVRRHAQIMATLVEKFPQAPVEAESVIKQHHGSFSGIGFPRDFSNNLTFMAIVLILCEEVVKWSLPRNQPTHQEFQQFIQGLSEKYPRPRYQWVIEALGQIPDWNVFF